MDRIRSTTRTTAALLGAGVGLGLAGVAGLAGPAHAVPADPPGGAPATAEPTGGGYDAAQLVEARKQRVDVTWWVRLGSPR